MAYKNKVLAALAVAGLSCAAVPVFAHSGTPSSLGGGSHGAPMWGAGGLSMLEGISLTKQQRKKIETILSDAHDQDQTDDIRNDMGKIHQQIQDQLTDPGPINREQINTLLQQQASLRAQQEARHLDVAERIHDVLTPEQLSQIKARQAKIHDLMEQLHEVQHPSTPDDSK
ncbi:hypothetical protein AA0313_0444 [Acetobacter indonesiensis NRIC 0313]|uniref:Periplasmic heavy metal sensor n=1 Tax=Acetobacter indonesiensis TaxID=104101 RepID=A0A6N3T252_9PROT|nr:periplasmic heavy metal sensor [Acetobacter indonesiensis]GAN62433.1 hypothetical protein Abin_007_123 [Acetobacter indonesiensis]GBQ54028.1 hypothetical protein AA0313_0444 [Acetobacter indonesiensis NRIC 0313]GEN03291.1 hypothetical protein AIN02nite_13160 [Acetobacter indonesiensis]